MIEGLHMQYFAAGMFSVVVLIMLYYMVGR